MAINRKQGHKVIPHVRTEDASGIRMDPGPFVGIVKHVLDPTRSGRLQVYLPHLGGDPDNPNNLKIVQYASPFSGHTSLQLNPNKDPNSNFTFETVRHSYGMWFTPPDIGVRVLVVFEASNANNGYWIACLPPVVEHNQLGSSGGVRKELLTSDAQVDALITGYGASYAPGVEYNAANTAAIVNPNALELPKPPHRIQTKILAEQGLLADPNRGIDDATTIRETPSGAFGITTPGRIYTDQATDDYLQQVSENPSVDSSKYEEKVIYGRKGGHQFIMDDGDMFGRQRRVKIRSAAGHQIIMDDTNGFIYISTSTGKNWIELTNDGQMLIYSESDISVRTGGDFNLKVDGNFNHEVNGDYNLKVRGNQKTEVDLNREEVVTGNKDVDISGWFDTFVDGNIETETAAEHSFKSAADMKIETSAAYSLKAANDIAVDAGDSIGLKSGDHTIIDSGDSSGTDSGWKSGQPLMIEAPEIGLNSGPPGTPVSPTAPTAPTIAPPFTLVDILDTAKVGDIWKHEVASESTAQTIIPKIPTHEPSSSIVIEPLISATGTPSKGV
jgi:hypothetical protein